MLFLHKYFFVFKIVLFLIAGFLLNSTELYTQQVPPGVNEKIARQELERRGLSEDAVRIRMKQKGFDIDNVDPDRLPEFQQALEETLAELEAEATAVVSEVVESASEQAAEETIQNQAAEATQEITESVQEGVPLEEAISEELLEAQPDLPGATLYGHHIFRNKSIKVFRQAEDIKAPDSYVLGPGDEIVVSIWGASVLEETHTISQAGYIQPKNIARSYLKGITFGKAKDLIRRRYGLAYSFGAGDFEVGLKYSRTISVNLTGEVINPGTFALPAINTAFNALMAADGPNNLGSVRNIKLVRAGSPQEQIDIYEYLFNPGTSDKYYLQEGDFIFVPVAQKIVAIAGAIKRPFRYELLEDENLIKLIEYAGGLQDNAYQGNIQIKRYVNDEEVIIDVDLNRLNASGGDYALNSGDRITIKEIPTPIQNIATINGAVDLPGDYEITPGMRLSDLIDKGVLSLNARRDIAYLIKTSVDNKVTYQQLDLATLLNAPGQATDLTLDPRDRLLILSQAQFTDVRQVNIEGAVRSPGEYTYTDAAGMRISDLVLLAGGLQLDATEFAYIYRDDESDGRTQQYLRIQINEAITNTGSPQNILLRPNDRVRVLSKNYFLDDATVSVSGAVRNPGSYRFDPTLKLKDVLTLAGGLQLSGASNRIEISRLVIQDNEPTETIIATVQVDEDYNIISGSEETLNLQPFDQILARYVPEFEFQQNVEIRGEVRYPGIYPIIGDNEKLSSLIERSGGLTGEAFADGALLFRNEDNLGYVVTKLDEVVSNPSSTFNLVLKAGDVIEVPKTQDIVSLKGAINAYEIYSDQLVEQGQVNIAFQGSRSAKWYIREFGGGLNDNASRKKISVEHPNGEIEQTKDFLFFKSHPKVRPGSIVSVGVKPPKPEREGRREGEDSNIDWGKVVSDSLAQVTAVLTLIVLLQRIN